MDKNDLAEKVANTEELAAIIDNYKKEIKALQEKEARLRWKQPEYEMYKAQAESLSLQMRETDRRLGDMIEESKTARYIIGTALFDILRHPLHLKGPIKRIIGCTVDKLRVKMWETKKIEEIETRFPNIKETSSEKFDTEKQGKKTWIIKCPAPEEEKVTWGDYHFCISLADALRKQGQYVKIHMYDQWDEPDEADVVLVLRGLHKYRPQRRQNTLYIMWNISHPEAVSEKEYNSYDIVFVASNYYAGILREKLQVPVYPLLQCTDTSRFFITDEERKMEREGLLFIGNGRIDGRVCVNWAASSGYPLRVIGKNWERRIDHYEKYVAAESIDNKNIREEYIKSKATLNNHWASMKSYQFINNRIMDALACELPIISDRFDELCELFPDEVLYYEDRSSFYQCIDQLNKNYDEIKEKLRIAHSRIERDFSFDCRAHTLISTVAAFEKSGEKREKESEWDDLTIILLWKQNDTGIYGRRHEMLMKYFSEDDRVKKIIIFDKPIYNSLLDEYTRTTKTTPYARNRYILEMANKKYSGLKTGEKIIQYNYIIPRGTKYNPNSYKNYIHHVMEKEEIGDSKVILWTCPKIFEFEPFLEELNVDLLVSDFIDDEREFIADNNDAKEKITANYKVLLKKSDFIFCNCKKVRQNLINMCPEKEANIHVIPNAAEPDDAAVRNLKTPERMSKISHPILGYIGNFSSRVDIELIDYLSNRHTDWQFVFIGSTHLDQRICKLQARSNIHILDVVPYSELPAYIENIDVAILPHVENSESSAMNPLKLFVYAMYRKPIVCTQISNIDEIRPIALVSESYEDFEKNISLALQNRTRIDEKAYQEILNKENWRERKNDIFEILFQQKA